MIAALLLAQLSAGPPCGFWLGTEITPANTPYTGCFVPSWRGDGSGAQLRLDPLAPAGIRATPIPARTLPTYIPPTQP